MGLLDDIVAAKRVAVAARRAAVPIRTLEAGAASRARPRDLARALRSREPHRVRLLAELKRASPVAGIIARGFDPIPRAAEYVAAGAAALSVLTDPHFQGSRDDLITVRAAVDCAILQKDFIIDEYQLWEACANGADAVLLIVGVLAPARLRALYDGATRLGLSALIEVHDLEELQAAAELDPPLVGINNRDLKTFRTDLAATERLAPLAPPGACLVAESGIATRADVQRVIAAGVDAVLVGEALSRSDDPTTKIHELLS